MRNFGLFVVGACLVWLLVAYSMPTAVRKNSETIGSGALTVRLPAVEVHNIGLIERRRAHLSLASLGLILGTVLIGFGAVSGKRADGVECSECAEIIKPEAKKCRFCGALQPRDEGDEEGEEGTGEDMPSEDAEVEAALIDGLGIAKSGGRYYFLDRSFRSLEEAVAYAKTHQIT